MGFHMLGSLLTVKLTNANAVSFKPDHELQKSAKKATVEYNKEHSSSTSDIKHGEAWIVLVFYILKDITTGWLVLIYYWI